MGGLSVRLPAQVERALDPEAELARTGMIRRGELRVAQLNPTRWAEAGKGRPVLVLQADRLTEQDSPTILIVPRVSAVIGLWP